MNFQENTKVIYDAMKTKIKTNLYLFSIYLREIKGKFDFEIRAICMSDGTKSRITNLNFIISELLEPTVTLEGYETTIQLDKNTGNKIYFEAIQLFNDYEWIQQLFIELEDDRNAGEWS